MRREGFVWTPISSGRSSRPADRRSKTISSTNSLPSDRRPRAAAGRVDRVPSPVQPGNGRRLHLGSLSVLAYLINGGCSDDGFAYFRSWLISRGRAAYAAAVRNPDSLAGLVDPDRDDYEFEDLWGIAQEVYEERTARAASGRRPRRDRAGWATLGLRRGRSGVAAVAEAGGAVRLTLRPPAPGALLKRSVSTIDDT